MTVPVVYQNKIYQAQLKVMAETGLVEICHIHNCQLCTSHYQKCLQAYQVTPWPAKWHTKINMYVFTYDTNDTPIFEIFTNLRSVILMRYSSRVYGPGVSSSTSSSLVLLLPLLLLSPPIQSHQFWYYLIPEIILLQKMFTYDMCINCLSYLQASFIYNTNLHMSSRVSQWPPAVTSSRPCIAGPWRNNPAPNPCCWIPAASIGQ